MTTQNLKYTIKHFYGKKKYECPRCEKRKCFSRFYNSETMEELAVDVGICDHQKKCGYIKTPKEFFTDNPELKTNQKPFVKPTHKNEFKPVSLVDFTYLKQSLDLAYRQKNNLYLYLVSIFNEDIASKLCDRYLIGTSNRWNGASIYWQVDIEMKIRTGCIILHNPKTGKRIHTPEIDQEKDWVHSILRRKGIVKDFNLQQCLFGEHLLSFEIDRPIAIVESERTAMICSLYEPEYVWLATGGMYSLNIEKCKVLKGRKVVLFPDLGKGFEVWSKKAKEIRHELHLNIKVSEFLEKLITDENEKSNGSDLEDFYLIKNNEGKAIKKGVLLTDTLIEWETETVYFK